MTLNERINGANRTAAVNVVAAWNDVAHRYQELGRDIETLRESIAKPWASDSVQIRIAACFMSCNILGQVLAKMQVAALTEKT